MFKIIYLFIIILYIVVFYLTTVIKMKTVVWRQFVNPSLYLTVLRLTGNAKYSPSEYSNISCTLDKQCIYGNSINSHMTNLAYCELLLCWHICNEIWRKLTNKAVVCMVLLVSLMRAKRAQTVERQWMETFKFFIIFNVFCARSVYNCTYSGTAFWLMLLTYSVLTNHVIYKII